MTAAPAPVPASTYADAWPVYRALGWHGTVPLPARQKSPPPKDTTGWHAPYPSGADCTAWAEEPPLPGHADYRGTTQLALRLPDTVIGIDVDAYGAKVGAQTIAEAARRWGPLPDGPWSSARDDGTSGIRLFRVPAGTVLKTVIRFEGIQDDGPHPSGGVEVIQHHHRYAVVWPSTNPKVANAPYTWRNTGGPGLAPNVDDLPYLPDTWIDGLRDTGQRSEYQGTRTEANELLAAMPDGDCPTMRAQVERTVAELRSQRVTRHDAALTGVLRVIRLGEMGHRGALTALGDLQRAFIAATADRNTPAQADAEFERMVYGSNGTGLVLSTRTPPEDYGCRHGQQPVPRGPRLVAVDGKLVVDNGDLDHHAAADEEPAPAGAYNLPDEFWSARPALKHIQAAALAGWGCPDAVLAACFARQSAYLHPEDTVDLGVGAPAPLTLFSILYGPPSAGKGVAMRIAERLLPPPTHLRGDGDCGPLFRERPLGSGEGLVETFYGVVQEAHPDDDAKKGPKVRRRVRGNALFVLDEGEAMLKTAGRNGSTIATTIRRAWSGELLGEANASADRDRQLDRGSYSIGLCIAFQPETIAGLFDVNEVGGGTPHRFLFAAADTDLLPDEPPAELPTDPGELDVKPRQYERGRDGVKGEPKGSMRGVQPIRFRLVDRDVIDELRATRWAGLTRRSEGSELDGHSNQMRGRVAAHLAWWDGGRTDVNGEDWHLAGEVLRVSNAVRDRAVQHGARKVQEARVAEDTRYVLREQAAREAILAVEEQRAAAKVHTAAAYLARKVVALVDGGEVDVPSKRLRDAAGSKYRRELVDALDWAVEGGWLVVEEGARNAKRYRPGPNAHAIPAAAE